MSNFWCAFLQAWELLLFFQKCKKGHEPSFIVNEPTKYSKIGIDFINYGLLKTVYLYFSESAADPSVRII